MASPNTASPTTGEYVLTVNGNTGTPPSAFSPGPDGCGGLLTAASPAHLWIGLKNGDDQGTQFDLKVELSKNGTVVASGLQRCITGVTRNAIPGEGSRRRLRRVQFRAGFDRGRARLERLDPDRDQPR